jgi:hypothetical protein
MATSFSGGGSWREPPTMGKQLVIQLECSNTETNINNIIDVNSTIQVRRVLWSGLYHTGSLLK